MAQEGPEEFLELPGAVELAPGIDVPEHGEGRVLPVGQIVGVLEQSVFQAAHRPGRLLVAFAPGLVPQSFAHPAEGVAHPGDDVERVQHTLGVGAVPGHGRVDPPGAVAGDDPDRRAPLRRQPLEEQVEDLLAVSVVHPDDPLALVVDDDGDVRVALAARRLVHADRRESVEHRRHRRLLYSVKSRWTCSALNLDTVGVQLEHRRRLVPCFVVCLVYFMRECLFR